MAVARNPPHPVETPSALGPESKVRVDAGNTGFSSSVVAACVAAAAFLVALLIINHSLFTTPIHAYSDFAANGQEIERAKHFRQMLGNYSRWGFHHPGPAFMYIWAFGEAFFREFLHLVPANMNAHILTIILLNTAFLFGTIGILARRCTSRLFVPVALGLSLFFIYVLNQTVAGSAILSIWMPHVLLFPFLFFVAVSAVVAIGEVSKLPWLVLTGLLLLHGHAAQPLFVGGLTIMSLVTLWLVRGRIVGLRPLLQESLQSLLVSLVLVVIFALPIVVDVFLHHPNNVQAIMAYNAQHQGLQNKPRVSLKYEVSFLDFVPDTDVLLKQRPTHLMSAGGSKPYVAIYWCVACLLLGLLVGVCARREARIPAFFKYLALEIAAVVALFYVWTLKMAGPLFNFNGYFFYGMQLLALLVMVAIILDALRLSVRPGIALALCALVPLPMFAAKSGFRNAWTGDPETDRLIASLPPDMGPVHLAFPGQNWLTMLGVVYQMKLEHQPFCVDEVWAPAFAPAEVCRTMDGLTNLVLTRTPIKCMSPCRVLSKDDQFEFLLMPYPFLRLPVTVTPENIDTLNVSFYGSDTGPVWSSRRSAVYFRLATDFSSASQVRVNLLGSARPGQPARISLNGKVLGMISAGPDSTDFVIDRSVLLAGAENALVIEVDNAKPSGDDPRTLGFLWSGLQLTAAGQ